MTNEPRRPGEWPAGIRQRALPTVPTPEPEPAHDGPLWSDEAPAPPQRAQLWVAGQDRRPDPAKTSSEEYFEALKAKLRGELLDTEGLDKIQALEPLIGDLLQLNTLGRVIGPSGTFKSFVLLDMCGHVGTGMKWHGHYVRQGTAVYLAGEGEQGVRKRVRAWEQHHGVRMDNVLFLPRPVQAMGPEWEVLTEVLKEVEPVLIVVDTQARHTVGIDENSNTDMGRIVQRMDELRVATGACLTLVHHTGHNGEHGRGASGVKGAMQSELNVSKKGDRIQNITLTIKSTKQKDEEEGRDLQFGLKRISLDGEAKPDGRPVTSLVLESLDALPERESEEGSVQWIVQRLNAAHVPFGWGRDRIVKQLAEMGIKASKEKIQEVVRVRKASAENLPPNLPYPPVTEPAPNLGAGRDETADQTCPGQPEGRSGQGASDLPAPSPPLRRGQVGHRAPVCVICETTLDGEWAAQGNDRHVTC